MPHSVRNRLRGRIVEIRTGTVVAHLSVQVGDNLVKSIVPRKSADGLAVGDMVVLLVKPTDVMVEKGQQSVTATPLFCE